MIPTWGDLMPFPARPLDCFGCGHDCRPDGDDGECYHYCPGCGAQLDQDHAAVEENWLLDQATVGIPAMWQWWDDPTEGLLW